MDVAFTRRATAPVQRSGTAEEEDEGEEEEEGGHCGAPRQAGRGRCGSRGGAASGDGRCRGGGLSSRYVSEQHVTRLGYRAVDGEIHKYH